MEQFINVFKSIIINVLTALYEQFWFSVILAVLFMFLYLYAKEHGWKAAWHNWWDALKNSKTFRRTFYLIFMLR